MDTPVFDDPTIQIALIGSFCTILGIILKSWWTHFLARRKNRLEEELAITEAQHTIITDLQTFIGELKSQVETMRIETKTQVEALHEENERLALQVASLRAENAVLCRQVAELKDRMKGCPDYPNCLYRPRE